MNVVPCTDCAVQENDFELIPTVRMEREHSIEGYFSGEFHQSISLGSSGRLKSEVVGDIIEKRAFGKKRPLAGRFCKFRS